MTLWPQESDRKDAVYLTKIAGRGTLFVRGEPRGWVAWKISVPRWAPFAAASSGLMVISFLLAWTAGLISFHATPMMGRVQASVASSPDIGLRDSIYLLLDSARSDALDQD